MSGCAAGINGCLDLRRRAFATGLFFPIIVNSFVQSTIKCLTLVHQGYAQHPIVFLQHACHEMPLHIKHRLLCLQYKVHLLTFREHPGLSLVTDCWQEIFPDSRNFCSFNMFTKHSDLLSHLGVLQVPNLPPWSLQQPKLDLHALAFIRRTGSHLIAPLIKSYIHEHYSHHVHIYTDGSATATTAGCGVYMDKLETINKRYGVTLTQTTSSFSSELYAILYALYCLFTFQSTKHLILSDSLSALQAISTGNWKKHSFTNKINLLSSNLHIAGYEVVLMWVPGHSGIPGNEIADTLAKLASSSIPQTDMHAHRKIVHSSLNPSGINPLIADHCLKVWNNEYVNNPHGSTYKTYFPQITQDYRTQKQISISLFRLRTGHCRLNSHLFSLGLHPTGLCEHCHLQETVTHFLTTCPAFQQQRLILQKATNELGLPFDMSTLLTRKDTAPLIEIFIRATWKEI